MKRANIIGCQSYAGTAVVVGTCHVFLNLPLMKFLWSPHSRDVDPKAEECGLCPELHLELAVGLQFKV